MLCLMDIELARRFEIVTTGSFIRAAERLIWSDDGQYTE